MRMQHFLVTTIVTYILASEGFRDARAVNPVPATPGQDSCGHNDEACCEGKTCKKGLTCQFVLRGDIAQNVCKDPRCGEDKEPCCQGKIQCLDSPGMRCTKGKCEKIDCGKVGKECCLPRGPVGPDFTGCQKGLQCLDRQCTKSSSGDNVCGRNDQKCCKNKKCKAGFECTEYITGDILRLACKAPGCGEAGEPCCKGRIKCLNPNSETCAGGKCKTIQCGKGEECCIDSSGEVGPDFTGCLKGLKCVKRKCAKQAAPCGRLKQMCCKGRKCERPLRCRKEVCVPGRVY